MTAHNEDVQQQIEALEQHMAEPEYTHEQLADAARILRQAFRHGLEESHSPAGAFAGGRSRARDESLYRSRAPERLKDLGYPEGTTSTWATRVQASASSRAHFSRPPIHDTGTSSARVHSIVNELPEPHLLLIRAEFMKPGAMQVAYENRLVHIFWIDYQPRIAAGLNRRALCDMSRAAVMMRGAPPRFFVAQLRDQLQVTRSNWNARYVAHWRAMLLDYEGRRRAALVAFLDEFDREDINVHSNATF